MSWTEFLNVLRVVGMAAEGVAFLALVTLLAFAWYDRRMRRKGVRVIDPQLFAGLKRCRCSATPSGAHQPGCPAFVAPGYEDRGTHYRVWHGDDLGLDGFNPYPGAAGYDVVSVPIGWNLQPSGGEYGALMTSLSGRRLTGQEVRLWGNARHAGFRTVASFAYELGPLDDDPMRAKVREVEIYGRGDS